MKYVVLLITILVLSGCVNQNISTETTNVSEDSDKIPSTTLEITKSTTTSTLTKLEISTSTVLTVVKSNKIDVFVYKLQDANFDELKNKKFDLAVVDIDDAKLTVDQIKQLNDQGKIIISYLSIGEAEDYRNYWKGEWLTNPPLWLEKLNPDWPGNYKVKYWDSDWQNIVFTELDEITATGYNGIYLDIVDGYFYWEERGMENADDLMRGFVRNIASRARTRNPDFMIFPQNAVELVEDDSYLQIINGVGKEDTWYNDDEIQDISDTNYVLPFLDKIVQSGKIVLAIDYSTEKSKICDFYSKAKERGYTPFVSNRELNKIEFYEC